MWSNGKHILVKNQNYRFKNNYEMTLRLTGLHAMLLFSKPTRRKQWALGRGTSGFLGLRIQPDVTETDVSTC
jgi:hypothetical protein